MRSLILAIASATLTGSVALAHDYKVGELNVMHPFIFETPNMARAAGGYMMIENTGADADRLIEVRADFPRVEIHTIEMDGDVAKMVKIQGLDLPAGEVTELAPGGLHVMFMGLSEPFEEGETVPAVLVFENSGEVEIVFNVEARPDGESSGHMHMNHGSN